MNIFVGLAVKWGIIIAIGHALRKAGEQGGKS